MNKKVLSFEEINPFVRYPHFFTIEPDFPLTGIRAYDYRIMYIYNGKGHLMIDNVSYEAIKGYLFLWRPGVKYSIHPDSKKPLSIIGVNFDFTCNYREKSYPIPPEKEEVFDSGRILEIIQFIDMEAFNKPIFLKNLQSIESILMELINEYMIRKKYYTHKMRALFLSILCNTAQATATTDINTDTMNSKVDMIIQYIHENYKKPISNEDIGQNFNFHPIYINRLMVKYTGSSLHQYLINIRISMAINLLQTTNKTITEVAGLVGFNDINYFSKYFKKIVGLSPKKYITVKVK